MTESALLLTRWRSAWGGRLRAKGTRRGRGSQCFAPSARDLFYPWSGLGPLRFVPHVGHQDILVNGVLIEILPCPGEILPCEGKAFILPSLSRKEERPSSVHPPRQGRTPSWLWWDFLVTNPPGRDRILVGTRTRVFDPPLPRQGPRHTVTPGHLGERP